MDRNIENINEIHSKLEEKGWLDKKWKPKDYHIHTGVRRKPKFKKLDITKVSKTSIQLNIYLWAYSSVAINNL